MKPNPVMSSIRIEVEIARDHSSHVFGSDAQVDVAIEPDLVDVLDAFIASEIGFLQMAEIVEAVLDRLAGEGIASAEVSLESVRDIDRLARRTAGELVAKR